MTRLTRLTLGPLVGLSLVMGLGLLGPDAFAQPAGSAAPAASGAPAPAVSGSASAAPPPAPPAPTATSPAPATTAPVLGKKVPGPPDPTPDQIAALAELQKEADAYTEQAKEYRSTITRIVKYHYEDRKRRVLSSLDREIGIEKQALLDAREEAIRRLEIFVARYSGAEAHPENTPDAMFRLAALYEERARADETDIDDAELANRLNQAIVLYKRIIREFPKYRELAGVYYYLGHALNDSQRRPEAQQVWRSLSCANLYPYPVETDAKDPNIDLVKPLQQDHDDAYWSEWERRHPEPLKTKGTGGKVGGVKAGKKGAAADDLRDELEFLNPYPATCVPLPQKVAPGQDPRYIAEVWWLIGDYHFNELGREGGPFNLNRAQAAYTNSLLYKKPPIYGVAMYKLAWTYFKQQRYKASVSQFVELLRYADEQEKLTGDPGADFRSEAFTYIAGSLTYVDFEGPDAADPYIPRNDVLDTETDPRKQEEKMHVAIDRVQDEALVPQKEKWTVEIYKALAQEYRELNQYRNTIEVSELILSKWPLDCGAPVVQNQIAEIYDTMMKQSREGTAEYAEYSKKALEARTKLADYVGANKPWTRACINDPEAIQTAEKLVRGGLRRAAADHTNGGRALMEEGLRSTEKSERIGYFDRALREYQLAAQGWEGYLSQDENAGDAYESRFWLADALHKVVWLTVNSDKTPTEAQVVAARDAASLVRDSNEDNKYLQPAAFFAVDVEFQQLQDQYRRFKASNGSEGIEQLDGVKIEGEGEAAKVVKTPIPPAVVSVMKAREDYIARVPPSSDVQSDVDGTQVTQATVYEFDIANFFFVYGDFAEAKKRFQPIYDKQCGVTPYGYKAWDRLRSMAAFEGNNEELRRISEASASRSCALTEEQKILEKDVASKSIAKGYYIDAYKAYQEAEKMPDGPDRPAAWRKAAALYKVALEKAPERNEAPEAAIYGANAFKQVGEYDAAIAMYELFIKEYGNEERLAKLENGDPKANPPVAKDPAEYQKRIDNLKVAYTELSKAYVLFFNYKSGAGTYDTVSKIKRFPEADRRTAATNAVILYANIGDDEKLLGARTTLYALNPSVKQKMEIDYLVASADLKRWDENGGDDAGNRTARLKAIGAMEGYYAKNKNTREAAPYLVRAAYAASKMHRVGKDQTKAKDWCSNTMKAFDTFKSGADAETKVLGSEEADMAAECAYLQVDAQLREKWDYETNHHRYAGVIDKVKQAFDKDLKEANDTWFPKLQTVIETYASPKWSVAARARQGNLYDSVRTGLYNATPPTVKLYTPKEEDLLKKAETSDNEQLQEQADAIRQRRREEWRAARERSLEEADKAMVRFYAESTLWAKSYKVRNEAVDNAIRRLAFFTDILGNPKMRDNVAGVLEPDTKQPFVYEDNIFLRTRPGLTSDPTADGLPAPLPARP